jgi:hypothetical protein
MIKLFGWQELVRQRVNAKRTEELKLVWQGRMLDMAINVVRLVNPYFSVQFSDAGKATLSRPSNRR